MASHNNLCAASLPTTESYKPPGAIQKAYFMKKLKIRRKSFKFSWNRIRTHAKKSKTR
jgi:hypothetical protein